MSLERFRLAARALRKQPAFASVVIVSLALGISLNTTMYGMLDALIHPNVEIRDAGDLYWIQFFGDYKWRVDNRARDQALATGMHTYQSITRADLSFGTQLFQNGQTATEAGVAGVGTNYFDLLGVRLIAGRTFIPSDETADVTPMVIEEGLAQRLFPNGESPLGARITVGRKPRVVIGVIPHNARFPGERYGAWEVSPFSATKSMYVRLIRLRPGATAQDAFRELDVIAHRIAATTGEDPKGVAFRLHQAADPNFQFRSIHYGLIMAVVAVLLVACANVANIQLARGLGRRRELALRTALGATRRGLIGHLLTETSILAVAGLSLGLVLTLWGTHILKATIPPSVADYIVEPQLSWRVLLFALTATTVCLVLVGLLPSITVSRTDPSDLLKSGAGTGATKGLRRRYAILVGVEIALALTLSSLAAVTLRRSFVANDMGFGYDPRPLATGFVWKSSKTRSGTFSELLQTVASRIKASPGVDAATASLTMSPENEALSVEDAGGVREFPATRYSISVVAPSYISTFGYRIVKGRDFLEGERDHGAVIVDEQTAHALWPNANPVGALIKLGDKKANLPYVRVVGVMGDNPRFAPKSNDDAMLMRNVKALGRTLYLPAQTDSLAPGRGSSLIQYVAKTATHPEKLPISLRRELDTWTDFTTFGVSSMDDALGLTRQRQASGFIAKLFSIFATLGIGLAAFGVYGVVAHAVAERRRELGVRVALGATSRDILHAVLRESVVVALAGAAGGLAVTKFGVEFVSQMAVPDDVYNAPLFAVVAALVVAVAAASALGPAIRATRINPTESLRSE